MGATLGLSYFIFIFLIFDSEIVDAIVGTSGALFLVIQQSVIMVTFLCTEQMFKLCKRCFTRNQED